MYLDSSDFDLVKGEKQLLAKSILEYLDEAGFNVDDHPVSFLPGHGGVYYLLYADLNLQCFTRKAYECSQQSWGSKNLHLLCTTFLRGLYDSGLGQKPDTDIVLLNPETVCKFAKGLPAIIIPKYSKTNTYADFRIERRECNHRALCDYLNNEVGGLTTFEVAEFFVHWRSHLGYVEEVDRLCETFLNSGYYLTAKVEGSKKPYKLLSGENFCGSEEMAEKLNNFAGIK